MKKHVAVIDCAMEYISTHSFNRLVTLFDIPFLFYYLPSMGIEALQLQDDPSSPGAYIVFGSTSNVEDRLQWHSDLSKFLKEELEKGIPVLGICFCHQLLSDTFSCPVAKNDGEVYHEGIRTVRILQDGFGLKKGELFRIVTSHGYEVKKINDDFIHLGTSDECQFDVLAHKKYPLLTLQGHPEASKYFLDRDSDTKLSPKDEAEGQRDGYLFIKRFLEYAGVIT